jgi:hypothetical protein
MYEKPSLSDYGSLTDLTAAIDFSGPEDGGLKLSEAHHS